MWTTWFLGISQAKLSDGPYTQIDWWHTEHKVSSLINRKCDLLGRSTIDNFALYLVKPYSNWSSDHSCRVDRNALCKNGLISRMFHVDGKRDNNWKKNNNT